MTVSPAASSGQEQQSQLAHGQPRPQAAHRPLIAPSGPPGAGFSPSAAFQQVKQTQASLARLTRVHQQLQCQTGASLAPPQPSSHSPAPASKEPAAKTTTFVDCLIRRFKDCFSEDFCTVPMFVVGNLSPGSDGTHLILPPCVSLGRQSISRFASPKNLRHTNSIRESCRSIEELDLGGNKLGDLIEVYKILQCTPNLKFLNLSENDLSRTSPVAMASCSVAQPATLMSTAPAPVAASPPSLSQLSQPAAPQHQHQHQAAWPSPVGAIQRSCLAPINQNHQPMATRRHSTLGQHSAGASVAPTSGAGSSRARQAASSRLGDARRLAAANALAQSKKTSSLLASKLANSAASVAGRPAQQASTGAKGAQLAALQASTMHLARSLSSLSAKDVAASSRSACSRGPRQQPVGVPARRSPLGLSGAPGRPAGPQARGAARARGRSNSASKLADMGARAFAAEPIAETDDVDMGTADAPLPATSAATHTSPTRATSGADAQPQQHNNKALLHQLTGSSGAGARAPANASSLAALTGSYYGAQPTTSYRRTFESVRALALNNTGCQWRVVCSILSRMPNLEELHLSLNNYERIDLEPQDFKHYALKRLYLCNNPKLTNWEELNKLLVAFPSLEALSIADCNISQIPDNLAALREWRKLCGLNINGWPIKEWPVVERLNQLPSLIDLKCRNLEVLNTIDEPRHHLIARLPKLQRLNGSEIEEREHAEKAFLRFFMANSHLERPSRFHELIQIHGEVTPVDVDVDLSPPSHAQVRVIYLNRIHFTKQSDDDDILMSEDFLVKLMDNIDPNHCSSSSRQQQPQHQSTVAGSSCDVQVHLASNSNNKNQENNMELEMADKQPVRLFKDEGQEVVAIEVDLRQSVRKFKSSLADWFGLNSQKLILYYIDHEMVGLMGPELIKHNQKKLWNYNVQDGDQFIVEEL